jgi:G-patch domain
MTEHQGKEAPTLHATVTEVSGGGSQDTSVAITTTSDDVVVSPKLFLQLQPKKRRRRTDAATTSRTAAAVRSNFRDAALVPPPELAAVARSTSSPLVIPAVENNVKWKTKTTRASPPPSLVLSSLSEPPAVLDESTTAAIRALQQEAQGIISGSSDGTNNNNNAMRVITTHANTFVSGSSNDLETAERQQYHQDVDALPPELSEHDAAYQQTPIAEFGAALLRGMGWTDDDDDNNPRQHRNESSKKDADNVVMPRPHRLGLGAIPAAVPLSTDDHDQGTLHNHRRRPRRPDQYLRDQKVHAQNETYRRERERQLAADKQTTLQNGSVVWIHPSTEVVVELALLN